MDLILFILSLYGLVGYNKLYLALAGQIVLATSYLGMAFSLKRLVFFSESNVIFSLIIFSLFFLKFNFGKQFLRKNILTKNVLALYFFMLVSAIIDIFINRVPFYDVLSSLKLWFFLSAIWVYPSIPKSQILKTLKLLLHLTVFLGILAIFDFLFGTIFLTEVKENSLGLKRAIIPSTYTLFFIIALLSNLFHIKKKSKIIFLIILIASILFSVIRSLIIAVIVAVLLMFLLEKANNFVKFKNLIALSSIIILVALTNEDVISRFTKMTINIETVNTSSENNSTTLLRYKVFKERFDYIIRTPETFFFGLGNLREENTPIIFLAGNSSRLDGLPDQLYSPDISWGNLLIRFGFFGTIIYLIFYFKLMNEAFKKRKFNIPYRVLFIYLFVNLTIISFASSVISSGSFWLLPILLYSSFDKRNLSIRKS